MKIMITNLADSNIDQSLETFEKFVGKFDLWRNSLSKHLKNDRDILLVFMAKNNPALAITSLFRELNDECKLIYDKVNELSTAVTNDYLKAYTIGRNIHSLINLHPKLRNTFARYNDMALIYNNYVTKLNDLINESNYAIVYTSDSNDKFMILKDNLIERLNELMNAGECNEYGHKILMRCKRSLTKFLPCDFSDNFNILPINTFNDDFDSSTNDSSIRTVSTYSSSSSSSTSSSSTSSSSDSSTDEEALKNIATKMKLGNVNPDNNLSDDSSSDDNLIPDDSSSDDNLVADKNGDKDSSSEDDTTEDSSSDDNLVADKNGDKDSSSEDDSGVNSSSDDNLTADKNGDKDSSSEDDSSENSSSDNLVADKNGDKDSSSEDENKINKEKVMLLKAYDSNVDRFSRTLSKIENKTEDADSSDDDSDAQIANNDVNPESSMSDIKDSDNDEKITEKTETDRNNPTTDNIVKIDDGNAEPSRKRKITQVDGIDNISSSDDGDSEKFDEKEKKMKSSDSSETDSQSSAQVQTPSNEEN